MLISYKFYIWGSRIAYLNCSKKNCRITIIDELSNEYDGKAVVGKVDVDNNQEFAAKYGVRNIPTVLLFKNGELVDRKVGVSPKQVYADAIEGAL